VTVFLDLSILYGKRYSPGIPGARDQERFWRRSQPDKRGLPPQLFVSFYFFLASAGPMMANDTAVPEVVLDCLVSIFSALLTQ
jgi:hypothetical protein